MASQAKWTYTAGTEGTGQYMTVLKTRRGKLAVRDLDGSFRIRVEPTEAGLSAVAAELTAAEGWKQPDASQNRFSKVLGKEGVAEALNKAKKALGVGQVKSVQNPTANRQLKQLLG